MQASLLERQMQETQQHLELVDRELNELQTFSENLGFLSASKEKQIISSLGKGVFIPAELKEKTLLVEIGAGILVKKTPQETQSIIEIQIKKLQEAKSHLLSRLEVFQEELHKIIFEFEKQQNQKAKN